jgi:hypothetical protein
MSTDTTTVMGAPTPQRPYRRRGMFWPLVLIGVGLIALLANYGLVQPVSFISILALWPVLLILLGIDIAFARRWPVPTLAAEVAVIAASLFLAATQPSALSLATFSFSTSNDCTPTMTAVSAARGSLTSVALRIDGGGARYHLTSGATAGVVEASSDRAVVCLRDRSAGSKGDVRLSQGGASFGGNTLIDVRVANDLPISLTVNGGAGEFVMDLHDVQLTDARVNVGASNATIVLPHPTGDVAVRLDGGASTISVEIPADVEARVIVSGGLIATVSTNPRATKSGSIIETPGYATAKDRVTVNISGGASSITVR